MKIREIITENKTPTISNRDSRFEILKRESLQYRTGEVTKKGIGHWSKVAVSKLKLKKKMWRLKSTLTLIIYI